MSDNVMRDNVMSDNVMSDNVMSDNVPGSGAAASDRHHPKQRQPRTVGGVHLGEDADRDTKRLAAAILEVLAGVRTPTAAAQALGLSLPTYYHVESRALAALVQACAPRPKGPKKRVDLELTQLRKANARLEREAQRQQALVRLAQRSLGLPPPPTPPAKGQAKGQGKKARPRRPVARALQVAARLQVPEPPAAADSLQQQTTS
jgi:hypothetical protein